MARRKITTEIDDAPVTIPVPPLWAELRDDEPSQEIGRYVVKVDSVHVGTIAEPENYGPLDDGTAKDRLEAEFVPADGLDHVLEIVPYRKHGRGILPISRWKVRRGQLPGVEDVASSDALVVMTGLVKDLMGTVQGLLGQLANAHQTNADKQIDAMARLAGAQLAAAEREQIRAEKWLELEREQTRRDAQASKDAADRQLALVLGLAKQREGGDLSGRLTSMLADAMADKLRDALEDGGGGGFDLAGLLTQLGPAAQGVLSALQGGGKAPELAPNGGGGARR